MQNKQYEAALKAALAAIKLAQTLADQDTSALLDDAAYCVQDILDNAVANGYQA